MSALVKYGRTYHYQWYVAGKKHSKSLKVTELAKAKNLQKILDGNLAAGEMPKEYGRLVIRDEIERFLEWKAPLVRARSIALYRYALENLLRATGNDFISYVDQLDSSAISVALGRFKNEMKCRLINPQYVVWKSWAKWLKDQGKTKDLISKGWPKIKSYSYNPARLEAYTADEVRLLRQHVAGSQFEDFFLFALYTGARAREVLLLLVRDVDLGAGVLRLRNDKTDGNLAPYRAIRIHADIFPVLVKRCEDKREDEQVLGEYCQDYFTQLMRGLCKRAGVTYRRYHGLRATFITHLLRSGVDLHSVMLAAGHTQIATTQKYLSAVGGLADVGRLQF
jgi:integrase